MRILGIDPGLFRLLAPLVAVQLVLTVVALVDWSRRRFAGGRRWLWLAVILVFATIGPIVYLLFGRREEGE